MALEERLRGRLRRERLRLIGLYEPDEAEFESVRREFNLHELAVEDAIHAHQRPKLEVYDDTLFVVLKTARYVGETDTVEFGEIMPFIGPQFVVAVRHKPASALGDVRKQHFESRPDLLRFGPGCCTPSSTGSSTTTSRWSTGSTRTSRRSRPRSSHQGSNPAERIYLLRAR